MQQEEKKFIEALIKYLKEQNKKMQELNTKILTLQAENASITDELYYVLEDEENETYD